GATGGVGTDAPRRCCLARCPTAVRRGDGLGRRWRRPSVPRGRGLEAPGRRLRRTARPPHQDPRLPAGRPVAQGRPTPTSGRLAFNVEGDGPGGVGIGGGCRLVAGVVARSRPALGPERAPRRVVTGRGRPRLPVGAAVSSPVVGRGAEG